MKTCFLDEDRFVNNTPPFFVAVRRTVPVPAVARGALHRLYAGPTQVEKADDLRLLRSGSTGFTNLSISGNKVARVHLKGNCSSDGPR